MEVNARLGEPEKVSLFPEQRCPFNRVKKFKDFEYF